MQTNQDRAQHYVLSGTSSCAPWLYIDEVYREVLRELLPFDVETDRSNLCRLLCDSPAESDIVDWFIGELASILPIDSSGAIRVHSSFIDFLTSESRSQEFFVDTSWYSFCMARNCLTILHRELGQSRSIDSLLYYGRFWIDHLVDSRHIDGADILQCLMDILENHSWEWWELLSLSGDLKVVLPSLRRFGDWYRSLVPVTNADIKLALIEDTIRFFSVMQNYGLDLYVCMLMSIPQTTEFVQHYGPLALCSLMSRSNITSRCVSIPPGYAILFTTVAFSPIGDLVAFGSQSGTILVYIAKTRTEKWSSNVDSKQPIHSLKFSPKGGTQLVAVSGDWAIQIWDVETGVLVALLDGHRGAIRSVAFSPDGAFIASVSDDASLRIWDAQEYSELFCFRDEELGIRAVTFSPDGRYIASGSDDGFVRILEWHPTINTATELRLLDTSIMPYGGSLGPESLAFLPGGSRGWPWRIAVVRNVATVWTYSRGRWLLGIHL
ncbi:Vegetative incompatibility protein HET-E-1 [Grifola frondosa]|uniref:Vegetative incompatibility protein HET-E-1 n=1 Tax=Grifola frondosa TaxID=5627 RepID=A0A1C7MKS0_GRIFR|nr:Vegetative incompatibility protein HET-E-1 [Grifola frondosa]